MLNNKIITNYIIQKKLAIICRRNLILIEKIKKGDKNLDYPLDLCFDTDYNIRINMEKNNKYNNEVKYRIKSSYKQRTKILYHSHNE